MLIRRLGSFLSRSRSGAGRRRWNLATYLVLGPLGAGLGATLHASLLYLRPKDTLPALEILFLFAHYLAWGSVLWGGLWLLARLQRLGQGEAALALGWRAMRLGIVVLLVAPFAVMSLEIHRPKILPALDAPPRAESVRFAATDGLSLGAWWMVPENEIQGAILFVHGVGQNRAQWLDVATILLRQDYGALLLDLRGHGRSEGRTVSFGARETGDLVAAADWLRTRTEAPLFVVGHSMGGAVVLQALPRLRGVRAVVTNSAFASLPDLAGTRLMVHDGPLLAPLQLWLELGARLFGGFDASQIEPARALAAAPAVPLLVIHGEDDRLIPLDHARAIVAAARGPADLQVIPARGHWGCLGKAERCAQRLSQLFER